MLLATTAGASLLTGLEGKAPWLLLTFWMIILGLLYSNT
jgi:hypothetical protein